MGSDYRQPLSESTVRTLFGQPCDDSQLVTSTLPLLGRVTCHTLVAPQLQRIWAAIEQDGLGGQLASYDGCYNCRKMTGGTGYSHHSWGIALDVNANERPDGAAGTDINFGLRGEFPHLRRFLPYFLAEGWAAGIQWRNSPDPMHFEARTAHGTGLLASGTLHGIDLAQLDGLTDEDVGYLRGYPEYAWAFAPVPRRCTLPNGKTVTYHLSDGDRATVLVADLAQALDWELDTRGWPDLVCRSRGA